jgi:hypothetical protein
VTQLVNAMRWATRPGWVIDLAQRKGCQRRLKK